MKKIILPLAVLALSLTVIGCSQDNPTSPAAVETELSAAGADKHDREGDDTANYEIIIKNMTPATGPGSSQPFSPPILATHNRRMHIFKKHHYASDALSQLAEDAVADPMLDMLAASPHVHAVTMGDGVVLPGGDMRFEIEAKRGMRRLSLVFMLVNTNDAFGGLDGIRLPRRGERTYMVKAWDAGSEMNTELISDIPGPCCGNPFMGTDEHKKIRRHHGITGNGDLDPDTFGWGRRVARVTVRRID